MLAVIGGDAVFDHIVTSAVAAGNDFGNHALTLAGHPHHSRLVHYLYFHHAVSNLLQGNDQYAKRLEASHDSARDLSRQYETLLGDRLYRAVLHYTDSGETFWGRALS